MPWLFRHAARVRAYALAHKYISSLALVALLGCGYFAYAKASDTTGETRYILGTVERQTIIASISGSGQVSASSQVDIKPRVSGDIVSVPVKEGQSVRAGAVIAYLDSSDAQKALRDAQNSLETAQLSLDKLRQPADALTLTQAQNNLAKAKESKQNAEDDLADAYVSGFNDVADSFLDFPDTITGLYDTLFKTSSQLGGTSQQNIDFYANAIDSATNSTKGSDVRADARQKYLDAKAAFDKAFTDYKATSRSSSPEAIIALMQEAYDALTDASEAVKSANNLIQMYQDAISDKNQTPAAISDTQLTSLNGYTGTLNSHSNSLRSGLNSVKSAQQSIANAERTIAESQGSLDKLNDGPDELDLRSAQLTLQQRQDALQDARDNLADYTVRAPFDGTIAKLSAKKGDTASNGTALATIITKQQIAELALNEVDASSVKAGQKATLTFDAIDGLTITGSVASVDTLGVVSQGVVSYTVKVAFDTQDERVKPGMTVNAAIQTAVHTDVLAVPASAVKSQNGSAYVQAFTPPLSVDAAEAQGVLSDVPPQTIPVEVGISDDTYTEIRQGLTEGQQIVARTSTGITSTASPARTTGAGARGVGGANVIRF